MEKYTEFEQAIRDTSLVMIDENISTQRELNRVYFRYKALPKNRKRFSNYYSNLFLGHNVTEMYFIMKKKLKAESDIFEKMPSESYVLSEPDLYYKENDFNSGATNICFILGHSGSGKSVMASNLVGDDIDHIELDDLLLIKDHYSIDDLKEYSYMFHSFFTGEGEKYYIGEEERNRIPREEYEDKVFVDFIKFAMDYAKQHRDKKYIIDGIWIYLYFDDPSVFEEYAVFIKGTSFLKSKIRTLKREMKRDKETVNDRRKMFGREVRNYLLDEKKIEAYRSFFSNKPDTVLRLESNDVTQTYEVVNNEMNNIDKCFVDSDADGIKAIMEKTEANTELSNFFKLIIINECKSALSDIFKD